MRSNKRKKIFFIFGTRPEAIKLAPLILFFNKKKKFNIKILITSQHKEMLEQILLFFKIKADYDLNLMKKNQKLEDLTSELIKKITKILRIEKPDCVIVQGDTTSSSIGAMAAFYNKIKVAHVEAGLRTHDIYQPFPEEINRKLISSIAKFHFAPTSESSNNLKRENINKKNIFRTGNTVIDALYHVLNEIKKNKAFYSQQLKNIIKIDKKDKILISITFHRRENLEKGLKNICEAILDVSKKYNNIYFVIPAHLNPKIRNYFLKLFKNDKKIIVVEPLTYNLFIYLLQSSYFVISDSGGVQEECPYLKKPLLIIRNKTERGENIKNNTAILCGINKNNIKLNINKLLKNKKFYDNMISSKKSLGAGNSSEKIFNILNKLL